MALLLTKIFGSSQNGSMKKKSQRYPSICQFYTRLTSMLWLLSFLCVIFVCISIKNYMYLIFMKDQSIQ